MRPEEMMRAAREVARRQWWLVALTIVAAVAAAALAGGGAKTTYHAQATFIADTTLLNRYKGIPTPDDVVRDVATGAVRKSIATTLGVPAPSVAGLSLSGFGNPQNRLLVSFSSPDRATALSVVDAADEAVLAYVAKRTVVERTNYQTAVDQAGAAIAKLETSLAGGSLDSYQRADLEFKLWQVQQARVQSKDIVDILSSIYQLQAEPTVTVASESSALASRLAGGALAGLFVGLLLAGVREALRRRRDVARP
jgi:hypothetical protein